MPFSKPNRTRIKIQPLYDKSFWCGGCDRSLVKEGEKCSVCGRTSTKTKKVDRKPGRAWSFDEEMDGAIADT